MNILNNIVVMAGISSLIFVIYLIIEQVTKHFFDASWHYGLLKIIMIFFLIPVGKIVEILLGRQIIDQYIYINKDLFNSIDFLSNTTLRYSFIFYSTLVIWILGVAILLIWQIICFIKFQYIIACSRKIEDGKIYEIAELCAIKFNITKKLKIYINENINTPMLVGFINPIILLPSDEISPVNAEYILFHELTHYKSKDLFFKLIMLVIRTIYWFNPIAYICSNKLDQWCEYACDEKNTINLSIDRKKNYGLAILETAAIMPVYSSKFGTPFLLAKQNLKERLLFMLNVKKAKKKKMLISLAIAIILVSLEISVAYTAETFRSGNSSSYSNNISSNHIVYNTSISANRMLGKQKGK